MRADGRPSTSGAVSALLDASPLLRGFVVLTSLASSLLVFRSGGLLAIGVAFSGAALLAALAWPWIPLAVLFASMPFLLIEIAGGVQVVHLLGAAAATGVIWAKALHPAGLRGSPLLFGGLLVVAAFLLASLASPDPASSIKLGSIGFVGLAVGCAIVQLAPFRSSLVWIMRFWMVGALASISPILVGTRTLVAEYGGAAVRGRATGTFEQPNYMVEFCMLTTFVALALIWSSRTRGDRVLGSVTIAACVAGAVLSLSRGGLLGFAAALLALCVLVPWTARIVTGLVIAGTLAVLVGAAAGSPFVEVLVERLASIGSAGTGPADERPLIWSEAYRMWAEQPLLGIGPGQFLTRSGEAGSALAPGGYYHAHNVVLQIGVEAGIVGLVAFVAAAVIGIAAILKALFVNAHSVLPRNALAALLAGLVGAAVHGSVDFLYSNVVMVIVLSGYLGIVAAGAIDSPPKRADVVPQEGLLPSQVMA